MKALVAWGVSCLVLVPAVRSPAQPLAYDTSAWELALPADPQRWSRADLQREWDARVARQKQRHEIDVHYYRIGHTLAFPLPVSRRPSRSELPAGAPNLTYPWLIWLTWELEERWRVLHAAWRGQGDESAGALLQQELAALAGWESFREMNDQPGLGAAHIAGCLAEALRDPNGWDAGHRAAAQDAAFRLIERDLGPWFDRQWGADRPVTQARLANIPVITLARAAQLARTLRHPRREAFDRRMLEILRVWARFRTGPEHHSEGTTYDGYLLDSVTGWWAALPEPELLRPEVEAALASVTAQWIHLSLPGRADLHAPLGDVEPEMTFWTTGMVRARALYRDSEAAWFLRRVPVARFPAAALIEQLTPPHGADVPLREPAAGAREFPQAISLRGGWEGRWPALAISVARNPMGHLQADGGHVVLGWHGRYWITDPGYQQYRAGEEREYTLGPEAHNAPTIKGVAPKNRAAQVTLVTGDGAGRMRAQIELAACYPGLPNGAKVTRDVWFEPAGLAVIRDRFQDMEARTAIKHHWLGGHALAWAFVEGWVRLSDGRRAVWFGTPSGPVAPTSLVRHPGSRGPIAAGHGVELEGTSGETWWVVWCDEAGGWSPPRLELDAGGLRVVPPRGVRPREPFAG